MNTKSRTSWHHAPLHVFVPGLTYMVTAGTLHGEHFYRGADRLKTFESMFFSIVKDRGWELRAWALFSNHYHFIAKAPDDDGGRGLENFIRKLHSDAAIALNAIDGTPGRQVWYQYWDKCLTFEKSYYARLNYVMQNPVKHGLVPVASQYPFCSAGWFEMNGDAAFRRKVQSFKFERLNEPDDFEPEAP